MAFASGVRHADDRLSFVKGHNFIDPATKYCWCPTLAAYLFLRIGWEGNRQCLLAESINSCGSKAEVRLRLVKGHDFSCAAIGMK